MFAVAGSEVRNFSKRRSENPGETDCEECCFVSATFGNDGDKAPPSESAGSANLWSKRRLIDAARCWAKPGARAYFRPARSTTSKCTVNGAPRAPELFIVA